VTEQQKTQIIKTGEFYQGDLFSAIVQDLRLKAPHQLQTRNLFSLSKKPRHEPIVHKIQQDGETLTVTVTNTSGSGLATVFDQDVLLFLISALVREYDATNVVSNRPEFAAVDYYKFKGIKKYAGTQSKQLYDAIHRLQNTFVEYVRDSSKKQVVRFNWISYFDAITNTDKSRIIRYQLEIPQTIIQSVIAHKVLTLDHSYFKLTSPIARFLYLYARKAVGRKPSFKESIKSLYEKSAAQESLRKFTYQLKALQGKTLGAGAWQYTFRLEGKFIVFHGRTFIEAQSKRKLNETLSALLTQKSLTGSGKR
jgi:plasmid replication initiation protein